MLSQTLFLNLELLNVPIASPHLTCEQSKLYKLSASLILQTFKELQLIRLIIQINPRTISGVMSKFLFILMFFLVAYLIATVVEIEINLFFSSNIGWDVLFPTAMLSGHLLRGDLATVDLCLILVSVKKSERNWLLKCSYKMLSGVLHIFYFWH